MSSPIPDPGRVPDDPGFTDLPPDDARPIDEPVPSDARDVQAPRDTPDSIAGGDAEPIEPPD